MILAATGPTSLIPGFFKIIGKIVLKWFFAHLKQNNHIHNQQQFYKRQIKLLTATA